MQASIRAYRALAPTRLPCAKCGRPLATQDARRTPTGYACPDYIKQRVDRFYNASFGHYVLVAGLALVAGVLIGTVLELLSALSPFYLIFLMTAIVKPICEFLFKSDDSIGCIL